MHQDHISPEAATPHLNHETSNILALDVLFERAFRPVLISGRRRVLLLQEFEDSLCHPPGIRSQRQVADDSHLLSPPNDAREHPREYHREDDCCYRLGPAIVWTHL